MIRRSWWVRMLLAAACAALLPRVATVAQLNLVTAALYRCEEHQGTRVLNLLIGTDTLKTQVSLLRARQCPSPGQELADMLVLLGILESRPADPLLRRELSGLYRQLNLEEDADRELSVAMVNSPSSRWKALLARLGLVE